MLLLQHQRDGKTNRRMNHHFVHGIRREPCDGHTIHGLAESRAQTRD